MIIRKGSDAYETKGKTEQRGSTNMRKGKVNK